MCQNLQVNLFFVSSFRNVFIYLRKWVGVLLPEIVSFFGEKLKNFRYYFLDYEIAISYLPRHSVF